MNKIYRMWRNFRFESSAYETPEFKSFSENFRREFRKVAKKEGLEILSLRKGHFEMYGFVKNPKTNKVVYFNTTDVRNPQSFEHCLYRSAKDEKDFIGGVNMFSSLANLVASIKSLSE